MNWMDCGVSNKDLIEQGYIQEEELRGIDEGNEVLQVFADAFEPQQRESGEDRACQRRRMSAFPVRERSGGLEFKTSRRGWSTWRGQ
jgi:hypothetical protein